MSRLFSYRARNQQGQLVTGNIEGENRDVVIKSLVGQGYLLLDVREAQGPWGMGFRLDAWRRVGVRDLAIFTRQFATMVGAGLPLLRCLHTLEEQVTHPRLREAARRVRYDLETGLSLWESLSKLPQVFSHLYVQMVRAGELGGFLDQALERLAGHLEREDELAGKVRNSLLYPGLVAGLALLVILFLISFVMPAFTAIYMSAGISLPLPSRLVLATGTFVRSYFYLIIIGLAVVAISIRLWAGTGRGAKTLDSLLFRLPLIGKMTGEMAAARFSRTMGTLVRAGIPVLLALEVLEDMVGNRVMADGISRARASIREGENMSGPLRDTGVFQPMIIQMIAVGEETGSLDEMLVKAAEYCEREVDQLVNTLVTLLEPALILLVAVLVGLVVLGALLPVFDMMTVLG